MALAAAARGLPVNGLVLWEAPLGAPGVETAAWSGFLIAVTWRAPCCTT